MNTFQKLQLAFAIIIIMFTGYGAYAIHQMDTLAKATENIFKHPLAVSNAARTLNTEILQASFSLTQHSKLNTNETIRQLQSRRISMQQEFNLIKDRYLGPAKDIDNAFKQYHQFFSLTDEIMSNPLTKETLLKQDNRLEKLNQIRTDFFNANQVLIDFASNKAQKFLDNSTRASYGGQVLSLVFVLLFSIIITTYIIRSLITVNKETAKQLHLIDQNILAAELNPNGKVQKISNALCRALETTSQEIIGTDSHFFINDPDQLQQLKKTLNSGKGDSVKILKNIHDQKVWFEMNIEPQFDSDFNISYFNVFFTDISSEKHIEEISITDKLTGLFNRNYFEMVFSKEINKAKRDKKLFGVILMDIDFFKQYNDTYGHLQGDFALKSVASVIEKNTQRSYDLAFRVGGEEFLIIFNIEESNQAFNFADKVRKEIESLNIKHDSSSVSKHLTASFGVGVFASSHLLNDNEIYNLVDQQLYNAKHQGRNQVAMTFVE